MEKNNQILLEIPRNLEKSTTVEFWDSDTKELYDFNCKQFDDNWIWKKEKITYTVNNLKYRCKELDLIDWNNYLAVFGCSLTSCTGINEKDSWPYMISKKLKLDLLNAGIPGGSNDLILENIKLLLNSKKTKPKFIIVSWTSLIRKAYKEGNLWFLHGAITTDSTKFVDEYNNFISNERLQQKNFLKIFFEVNKLCATYNIPIWNFTSFPYNFFTKYIDVINCNTNIKGSIEEINKTCSRDIQKSRLWCHPGKKMQIDILNFFEKNIMKDFKNDNIRN